jgi:uroporphyrinogen-III decarboxylase
MEWDDMFGVPFKMELASGPIPAPGKFILTDITKWRDVIKRPAILDEIDWELTSKKDLENINPDLLKSGFCTVSNGYFMILTYFMGFDNALCACVEEPDEVKDLLNFILDLNLEIGKKFIYYYRPDTFGFGDDIAHERAPFVSHEMFLDIFEPVWRKHTAMIKEADLPAEHHNCGAFGPFVPYIVDMGFNAWNPAQPTYNDLPAIKARFGNKLAIVGGFESNGFVCLPETTEEEVRAEVRRTCDLLAPGGGFSFGGFIMGLPGDEEVAKRQGWINDEFEKVRYSYYN